MTLWRVLLPRTPQAPASKITREPILNQRVIAQPFRVTNPQQRSWDVASCSKTWARNFCRDQLRRRPSRQSLEEARLSQTICPRWSRLKQWLVFSTPKSNSKNQDSDFRRATKRSIRRPQSTTTSASLRKRVSSTVLSWLTQSPPPNKGKMSSSKKGQSLEVSQTNSLSWKSPMTKRQRLPKRKRKSRTSRSGHVPMASRSKLTPIQPLLTQLRKSEKSKPRRGGSRKKPRRLPSRPPSPKKTSSLPMKSRERKKLTRAQTTLTKQLSKSA